MRPNPIAISLLLVALGSFAIGYLRSSGSRDATVYEQTEAALREPSMLHRSLQLATLFESATSEELEEITEAVEAAQIGVGPGLHAFEMLGERWARSDPRGTIERSATWDDFSRRQLWPPLMRAWARVDGTAAAAYSETVADEALRRSTEAEVVHGRFEANAEEAWAGYANGWPYGRDGLRTVLTESAYRHGLQGLIDRVERLPESVPDDFRVSASREVAWIGGRLDAERTARFVEAHADSPIEGLRDLQTAFVSGWLHENPRAALDWLLTQPADDRRSAALRRAFSQWAFSLSTRDAAVEWLEAQPEEVRRPLLDVHALALVGVDPARAIALAEQIGGPKGDEVVARIRRRVKARGRTEHARSRPGGASGAAGMAEER